MEHVPSEAEWNAMRERLSRLEALVAIAFDGLAIVEDGVIVDVTDRLLEISAYPREAVIGRDFTQFIADDSRAEVRRRQRAGAEGRVDVSILGGDGRRRVVEVVSRNHTWEGRTVRLSAVRDVTDVRRLELQLRHAQKMDALGRLASGVAHDFNNLLTVIKGLSDTLVEDLTEPQRGDAREIRRAVDAGSSLTRQLLTFSRMEDQQPTLVDVNEAARGTVDMARRLIGSGILLDAEFASDAGFVYAESAQLQQAFLNLVINARDAMPHGGRLSLHTRSEAVTAPRVGRHPGQYAVVEVCDTGTGMTDEVMKQIFQPFFTTKDPDKGTGLGLALVALIVERAGGYIAVQSTIGSGSAFAIYLPSAQAAGTTK